MPPKPLPPTMLALTHHPLSSALSLSTIPLPTPTSTQHLLRVHAVTLSAGELLWVRPSTSSLPSFNVPGVDVAGTVLSAPATSRFRVGDEVYARTTFPRAGNAKEYTVAEEEELALKPKNLSAEEAVTIPMSALTAWQGLFEHGGLSIPGGVSGGEMLRKKRVLVTAASGGCGVWAVQLAKLAGAYVIATCGPSKVELVKSLGADEVLDYSKIGLKEWVEQDPERKVDLVFDCVNPQSIEEAWLVVKRGGLLLTITPPRDMKYKEELEAPVGVENDARGRFFIMKPDGRVLEQVSKMVEEGRCRPVVDSVWEMEEWEKALGIVDGGHAMGKVVLRIGG